jgi:hypothetical protein
MHLDPEVMGDVLSQHATAGALEVSANDIAAGPGRLFKADVILDSAAPNTYFFLFDAATPTGVPVKRLFVPAGGQGSFDFGVWGMEFSTGITLATSTTLPTYTATTAVAVFQATYL